MRRKCIFGCPGDYPLFKLPKDETVLKQWLDFIIQNNTPTKKNWHICARHFTDDSFLNKREFDSGLITRLSLKDDAIPTLRGAHTPWASAQVSWKATHCFCQLHCFMYDLRLAFIILHYYYYYYYNLCSLAGLHHVLRMPYSATFVVHFHLLKLNMI